MTFTDGSLWRSFSHATPFARAEAERRLDAVLAVEALIDGGTRRCTAIEDAASKFGVSGSSIRRWCQSLCGIDRSEWLPALAPRHARVGRKAGVDDEMWKLFIACIQEGRPSMPVKHAWLMVRGLAAARSAAWPSYDSVLGRWNRLPLKERRKLRKVPF